jgi:putative ABC transport system permease protein
VNFGKLAARNLLRNKFRVILTILGVAIALVAFVMLRTVLSAWEVAAEYAAKDRVGTRHKVSFVMSIPKRYIDRVREVPGVQSATWANWFGAKDPNAPDDFFATLAVDPVSFMEVYDEAVLDAESRQRWLDDRQGAVIGDVLARKKGWEVGDRVTLSGTIYPGDWEFRIAGIYRATRKSIDGSQFLFHWDYLNEALPPARQEQIGWIISRIDDPARSAEISRAIDDAFDSQDIQTLSMSERAMNVQFLAMFDALLKALNWVSLIILVILLMILGNTVAMGVRERTNEYGVLRAIGFLPKHVVMFVLGESMLLGLVAGVTGLGLSFLIVQYGMGRWLEENMGGMFPYFRIEPITYVWAIGAAIVLGAVAASIPAWRASRLGIVDSLRRLD